MSKEKLSLIQELIQEIEFKENYIMKLQSHINGLTIRITNLETSPDSALPNSTGSDQQLVQTRK